VVEEQLRKLLVQLGLIMIKQMVKLSQIAKLVQEANIVRPLDYLLGQEIVLLDTFVSPEPLSLTITH
jgi:hypothetical protein